MSDSLKDYILNSATPDTYKPEDITLFVPIISTSDRKLGEITRYFTRFVTHDTPSDIIEIDNTTFQKVKNNPFYISTSIRWQISGPLDDSLNLGIFLPGVKTANSKSIAIGEESLPGLSITLSNHIQFWQF